jgi:glycosyltransferase involved in cell wall biosynthesis
MIRKCFTIGVDLTSKIAHLETGMANSLHSYLRGAMQVLESNKIKLFVTESNFEKFAIYNSAAIEVIVTKDHLVREYTKDIDAIHLPFNETKDFGTCKKIITVYDLIPEHFPDKFPAAAINSMREATKEADFIFTISKFSEKDIIERHGIDKNKVFSSLIPFYVDKYENFEKVNVKEKYGIKQNLIMFYPAAGRPHKNHETLFAALEILPKDIGLVLSTGESHGSDRLSQLEELAKFYNVLDRVYILGRLPECDYYNMFNCSTLLVFPSSAEGYGLPIVEALALNCPIICSNSSCLPEIADDAALYFDTFNYEELSEKIKILIYSKDLQNTLINKGRKRFQLLSSSQLHSGLFSCYQRAINLFDSKEIESFKKENMLSSVDSIKMLGYSSKILRLNGYIEQSNLLNDTLPNQAFIPKNSFLHNSAKFISSISSHNSNSKKIVVIIDCSRLLSGNMYSGISRYIYRIIENLFMVDSIQVIPMFNSNNRGVPAEFNCKKTTSFCWEGNIIDLLAYEEAIKFSHSFDRPIVYHSPYHPLPSNREKGVAYVLTVCDIFHVTYSHLYNNNFNYITKDILKSIDSENDELLCISRFTAKDVISYLGDISITYTPLSPFDIKKKIEKEEKRDTLLIPFQNDPRKGINRMLESAQKWLSTHGGKVLIYGKTSLLQHDILNMYPEAIELVDSPTDEELVALYKRSFAFLYLSELEGFGMPPLEAMQYGCPPIITRNSSLAEIYMGWDYLIDNDVDIDFIVSTIEEIKGANKDDLLQSCTKILKNYSWEITTSTHIASYLRAISKINN